MPQRWSVLVFFFEKAEQVRCSAIFGEASEVYKSTHNKFVRLVRFGSCPS